MAKNTSILDYATGPIRYPLTNDYMFHAVLQKNERVLRGLVCSLLGLADDDIISLELKNPIQLGETVSDKDIVLDIRLIVGQNYKEIIPALHIGILNFTLFPESPEFYARNLMMNTRTHQIFSSDFALNVLDLKSIHLATKEDKACKLDYWARLFTAKTWEEIKMLAKNNETIHEAVVTMCELSADDKIDLLEEYGPIPKELSDRINQENNLDTLKKWLKLSAKVSSIEEFVSQM